MTTHTPEEIETVARLVCEMQQLTPERIWDSTTRITNLKAMEVYAIRALDALQAKGWKITTPHEFPTVSRKRGKPYKPLSWSIMHDAAPIVPRGDA